MPCQPHFSEEGREFGVSALKKGGIRRGGAYPDTQCSMSEKDRGRALEWTGGERSYCHGGENNGGGGL